MSTIIRKLVPAVLAVTLLPTASAGTVVCEGTVSDLAIHQPGLVAVRLSSMNYPVFICRIDGEYTPPGASTVSPATCKAQYAALLAAKSSNATLRSVYFDGDSIPTTCNGTVPPGAQVSMRYFVL